MQEAQVQQVLGPDTLYNIFGNLSDLVDFQHRFLALIEEIADRPPYDQHFGKLFVELEISFAVYEPFCANIQTAQDTIAQETPRLLRLSSIMNPTFELPSNLIKPVQRLCRYPLLIQELIKATPKDWVSSLEQLREGLVAIQRVTTRVNETKRRQENAKIVHDLRRRVKGSTWKRSIGSFGLLLLQEKFTIERNKHDHHDVHIYLFEKSLLICERDPERRASTISVKKRNSRLIGGNGLLAVRGRIFISQIAQVDTDTSRPGKYKLQLFWSEKERKTPASFVITSCTIICRNKEQLCQWETTIQKLVRNEKILSDDMKPPLQQRQKSLIPRPAAAAPVPELVYGSSHLHIDEEWDRSSDDDDMNTIYRHYPQELLGQFEEQNCSAVGGQSNKICNGSGMHNAVVPRFPRDGSPPSLLSNSYPSTPSTIGTRSSAYLWNRKPSDASTLPTECSDSVSALSADDDRLLSLESSNLSQARSQSSPSIYRPLSDDDDDDEYSLSLLGQRAYTPYYVFSSPQPQEIKLRLHFEHELYLTMMPIDMTFNDLALRVDKKLTQLSTIPKPEWITLKYLDEDGDMITIETDEDVQMGLEGRREANAFNIYIIALSKKVN
ncbi:hypothetical protein BX666DRAFT_1314326 [Dichotomocladium elegans]|nr:hypothetical protein BX666DRAFT_1314326 [Dichotomocladium elegans]